MKKRAISPGCWRVSVLGRKSSSKAVRIRLLCYIAPSRSIEECIALLPTDSPAVIDEDFAADVAAAVEAHRESLNPPAWD
ncbi:MAG: hypothetical protein ABR987_03805 [Terracidiphilus sp.]